MIHGDAQRTSFHVEDSQRKTPEDRNDMLTLDELTQPRDGLAAALALRTAAAAGVTEPGLINKAMATELEALRATRLTEMAEMDEILAALEPHLTEAGNA